jgi:hypothetical protein
MSGFQNKFVIEIKILLPGQWGRMKRQTALDAQQAT